MKYLEFYKDCLEKETLKDSNVGGLCGCGFKKDRNFKLLKPDPFALGYWAHGDADSCSMERIMFEFTPLRQNIVLFLAAMNNEL